MKNLFLILLMFGGLIGTVSAQKFQKHERPSIRCNVHSTIDYPSNVPEGWDFKILVKPATIAKIDRVKLYIDNRYIGVKSTAAYQWALNTTTLRLTPGAHTIRVMVISECGNSRQTFHSFTVNRLR